MEVVGVRQKARMRAVVHRRYGPPEVLEYAEVAAPLFGDGDALIRVWAAAVHPGDCYVLAGVPYVMRLQSGIRRPRNPIRGCDLAGVVEAAGKDVTDLAAGDEVFGWSSTGTLAEYVSAPADHLVRKPARLTMEQAAAVPTSAFAALQARRDVAGVQPGQTVLVTGASGGVGTFAVQLAKALGAEVTGVCSTRNLELVRSLGADQIIDYTRTDFTPQRAVLRRRPRQRRSPLPDGGPARVGAGGHPDPQQRSRRSLARPPGADRQGARAVAVHPPEVAAVPVPENRRDLIVLADLIDAGQLTPVIDRTYPLG